MYNNNIDKYAFKNQTNMIVHNGVYYFNYNAFQCITDRFNEIDAYKEMDWNKLQKSCKIVFSNSHEEILPDDTNNTVHPNKHTDLMVPKTMSSNIDSITRIIGKEHKRTADENMILNVKIMNGLKQAYGDIKEIDDTYIAIMAYGYNSFDAYRELLPILDSRVR